MEDRPVTGQSEPRAGAFKEGEPELGDRVTLKEREDELHDGGNAKQETKDVENHRTPFRSTALNPQKQCDDAPLCEHSGWESQEKGNPGPVKSVEYLQKAAPANKGNTPTRHIDQSQTRGRALQQQSRLAGRQESKVATKRQLEEKWKARWTEYQQQTGAAANGNRLSIAARTAWDRGLRTKEKLTRAESTVATLLRTKHIGLNDDLCRRRVSGFAKPDCDCGWPRETPKHIIMFSPTSFYPSKQ
ncbi:Hypothetical protein D9617_62g044130 [Elsinoe fawcettii]|nr:Hypothetical protein D9617_62g044130 [Elsinoe fawcettii]